MGLAVLGEPTLLYYGCCRDFNLYLMILLEVMRVLQVRQ